MDAWGRHLWQLTVGRRPLGGGGGGRGSWRPRTRGVAPPPGKGTYLFLVRNGVINAMLCSIKTMVWSSFAANSRKLSSSARKSHCSEHRNRRHRPLSSFALTFTFSAQTQVSCGVHKSVSALATQFVCRRGYLDLTVVRKGEGRVWGLHAVAAHMCPAWSCTTVHTWQRHKEEYVVSNASSSPSVLRL